MTHKSKLYQALDIEAPSPKRIPHVHEIHGHQRQDPYYWMRERDHPDVLDYLRAENTYLDQAMTHLKDYQEHLFDEMKSRIPEDEVSVPYLDQGHYYAHHYRPGDEYPVFTRGRSMDKVNEEVLLDQNKLAEGHTYHDIKGMEISDDSRYLLFGEDSVGRRQYKLRILDTKTGAFLTDEVENTSGNAIWANDNKTFYYTRKNDQLRPYKVYRHVIGTDMSEDVEVYHEQDAAYHLHLEKTISGAYITITCSSTLTTEELLIDANDASAMPTSFGGRQAGIEYDIEHADDGFYIITNYQAKNFQLFKSDSIGWNPDSWSMLIAGRADVLIEDIACFKDFIVVNERAPNGLQLRILHMDGRDEVMQLADEPVTCYLVHNFTYDTSEIRLAYTSLTRPKGYYSYNANTSQLTLLKEQQVIGGYDRSQYVSTRLYAVSADGIQIPISVVTKPGALPAGHRRPLLLMGYGAYGISYDVRFSTTRLSLLDRGFAIAVAHVRGGEDLGRQWYEDGRQLNKQNTFSDFIACAEHLKATDVADDIYAMGGSAGGLLMGAIVNQRPDLWAGVLSAVPFVDVVTTMLDDTIPLTTGEYDEWGNPHNKAYYDYILSYSPYDNLEACSYPPMLVTTGYHDSQVQYWEPAKYVAQMRHLSMGDHPLLFYTDMEAGHGGASGRYHALEEIAMEYAFILDLAGLVE